MDNAIAARKAMNASGEVKISFNDLVVKACALALKKHPVINSSWMGDFIRTNQHVHIGVAVAIEDGLLVPVLRHADQMPLAAISANVKDLAGRAKDKKLQPSDWEGNTFTISNLGMFGSDESNIELRSPSGRWCRRCGILTISKRFLRESSYNVGVKPILPLILHGPDNKSGPFLYTYYIVH